MTRADVEAARVALEGVVRRTPVEPSRVLAESAGGPVRLKCENLQRTGSFKIRGAYRRIAGLSEAERGRGVVAYSRATTPREWPAPPRCLACGQ